MSSDQISSIPALAHAADAIWSTISNSCATCEYPDCVGYIWTVESEQQPLLQAGVKLVQINGPGGPVFLDTYKRDDEGRVLTGMVKPPCPYRDSETGACTTHDNRPLVCHLYPLGIETVDQNPFWVLYRDCAYIDLVSEADELNQLERDLRALVARIDVGLAGEIRSAYRLADDLSSWPNGRNSVSVLVEC